MFTTVEEQEALKDSGEENKRYISVVDQAIWQEMDGLCKQKSQTNVLKNTKTKCGVYFPTEFPQQKRKKKK